jgi:hypothetical protein
MRGPAALSVNPSVDQTSVKGPWMAARSIRYLVILGLVLGMAPFSFGTAEAHSFGSAAFERTWARTDLPVAEGQVNRTWMWGPSGRSEAFYEDYIDAPGGTRLVQYTDKSRMEDNSYRASAPWDVTNGRLAYELITGRMQAGDAEYHQWQPAAIQVAGDSHPDSPTYATFNNVLDHDPIPTGWTITQTIDRHGTIGSNSALGQHGVTAQHYVPETNHTVASVFWTFMNSSGTVFQNGQYVQASLFENPFFATGFPISEAYWMHVPVGGQWRDVLGQCFERRCLTFTPGNPAGWQVEAGNIGQHYYQWRYGDMPPSPPPAPPPLPPGPDPDEIAYLEDLLIILEATEASFYVFLLLLENPTFTIAWYDEFDLVMEIWHLLHPALSTLSPPASYGPFHATLLNAYWQLGLAADHFIIGFYLFNEHHLDAGLFHLEEFSRLFDEAFALFPGQEPIFLDESSAIGDLDHIDELLDPARWERVLELAGD